MEKQLSLTQLLHQTILGQFLQQLVKMKYQERSPDTFELLCEFPQ